MSMETLQQTGGSMGHSTGLMGGRASGRKMAAGKEEAMENEGTTELVIVHTRPHKRHGQMKWRRALRKCRMGGMRMDVRARGDGRRKR